MFNFIKLAAITVLILPFVIGCGVGADTTATSTGVDDSVVHSQETMDAMEADYKAQMRSE
ncbi:hypothetical protein [Rubripirellula reticaptiva]|uniref:Secreted protein n=1 Tax=Rubripirellula reticaptiva TaxID=2528013 RepID=A0A5C6ESJ3_9BACT|nr:hypothetical protein [Rubripirellula reticaptiva]TWU51290.1 hypothetical protein Poly59_28820 [Rubripirellula reticaptiva]